MTAFMNVGFGISEPRHVGEKAMKSALELREVLTNRYAAVQSRHFLRGRIPAPTTVCCSLRKGTKAWFVRVCVV